MYKITTQSNLPIEKSEAIMEQVNAIVQSQGEILRLSGSIGSEAGVLSMGSGSGIDHLSIVATYVNRHEREETIWQIATSLRSEIAKIPNIKQLLSKKFYQIKFFIGGSHLAPPI